MNLKALMVTVWCRSSLLEKYHDIVGVNVIRSNHIGDSALQDHSGFINCRESEKDNNNNNVVKAVS